jgi:hypothetical protein
MDYSSNNSGSGSAFNQFNSNKYLSTNLEFLESNSIVAKVAFLLLVLFSFIILLRIGISILGYFFSPTGTPKLINGMVDAKQQIIIPQEPSSQGAVTITRSVNADDGIEFTWSVWIYIDDLTYNSGKYKCVFYKGNDYATNPNTNEDQQGLNFPNNAPGLYIAPNTNNLVVFMNTFNVINEEITINDIPLNKWVNVIIRCQNNTLDVYINGTIAKSHKLHGVPKQNYGNVYVASNGGFAGNLSDLRYFNYALPPGEIVGITNKGPNLTASKSNVTLGSVPPYLSFQWYTNE